METFCYHDVLTLPFVLNLRLAFGTPALRVDLVDAAIRLTTTYNRRDLISDLGSLFTFPLFSPGGSYAQVKVIGPILSFDYISRHVSLLLFDGL